MKQNREHKNKFSSLDDFDLDQAKVSNLGSGSFANVVKVKCKTDGQFYAIKIVD